MQEIPTITASSYSSSALVLPEQRRAEDMRKQFIAAQQEVGMRSAGLGAALGGYAASAANQVQQPTSYTMRIVKVIIADINDNLPLDKRVLFNGPEHLTDATDQELYFEVPVAELLAKHNELRKTTLDKKASDKSGRDIFLEPARVRDLKMVVVNIATF